MDSHICGQCQYQFSSLEDFIFHKIDVEKCKLDLSPSTKIKDLVIPSFKPPLSAKDAGVKLQNNNLNHVPVILKFEKSSTLNDVENDKVQKCEHCSKTFSDEKTFLLHGRNCGNVLSLSKKLDKNCNLCGITLKSTKFFRSHQKLHLPRIEFKCKFSNCKYAFKTKGSLKRHERRHTGERPYSCELCGRNFSESGALIRHKRARILCTNKSDVDLPRYGKRMEDNKLGNLIDGIDNTVLDDLDDNGIVERTQVCTICDIAFNTAEELKNHYMIHVEKELYKCGVCTWSADKRETIVKHFEDHHRDVSIRSPCEVEVIVLIDKTEDNRNDGINFVPLQPEVGNSEKVNVTSFPGIKSLECPFCAKKFTSKSNLGNHLTTHSDERHFKCGECGKMFKRVSHVREHIRTIHLNDRPFFCQICDKSFKTMSSMKTHTKIHRNDLPFECNDCGKCFREKGALNRHNRMHTGEKPFTCKYCGSGFAEHGTLNRHLKAKTPCYLSQEQSADNEQHFLIETVNGVLNEDDLTKSYVILTSSELNEENIALNFLQTMQEENGQDEWNDG